MKKDKWLWMGHAGHLIVSNKCQFHLNTYVGGYIVSTVGEYMPDSAVREVYNETRKLGLVGMGDAREADFLKKNGGFERLGAGEDSLYETMVFRAARDTKNACCPWSQNGSEMEMNRYATAAEAQKGHLKLCLKWSKKLK